MHKARADSAIVVAPGVPSLLSAQHKQELGRIVEAGPDPAIHGVVRWRRIDLVEEIKARFGVVCSERAISDYLAELGFSHMSERPQLPTQDEWVIEAFNKMYGPPKTASRSTL